MMDYLALSLCVCLSLSFSHALTMKDTYTHIGVDAITRAYNCV